MNSLISWLPVDRCLWKWTYGTFSTKVMFPCIWIILKGTLHEDQNIFLPVSRLAVEGFSWKITCWIPHSPCICHKFHCDKPLITGTQLVDKVTAFAALILWKFTVSQLYTSRYDTLRCTEIRWEMGQIQAQFHVSPYVYYSLGCTNFAETHKYSNYIIWKSDTPSFMKIRQET